MPATPTQLFWVGCVSQVATNVRYIDGSLKYRLNEASDRATAAARLRNGCPNNAAVHTQFREKELYPPRTLLNAKTARHSPKLRVTEQNFVSIEPSWVLAGASSRKPIPVNHTQKLAWVIGTPQAQPTRSIAPAIRRSMFTPSSATNPSLWPK